MMACGEGEARKQMAKWLKQTMQGACWMIDFIILMIV
jgi:hypothetical protein